MGIMPPPEKCHITGLKTTNFRSSFDLAEYIIQVKEKRLLFRFHCDHQNNSFVNKNKHILYGMILNDSFPKEFCTQTDKVLNNKILEQIIREAIYPKTPEDKINYLLNYLHSLQEYEGSRIDFPKNEENKELALDSWNCLIALPMSPGNLSGLVACKKTTNSGVILLLVFMKSNAWEIADSELDIPVEILAGRIMTLLPMLNA